MNEANGSTAASTQCCIVGGGPAGMMLGYLLARAGVRDRRAREARRLPARLPRRHRPSVDPAHHGRARPARRVPAAPAPAAARARRLVRPASAVQLGDFGGLPERYAFIAMMPQWEFLDFLVRRGEEAAGVHAAHAGRGRPGSCEDGGRVVGVRGTRARRRVRDPRRLHGRLRRPPLDRARRGRARGRGRRRADRRALVSRRPRSGRDRQQPGADRARATSSSRSTAATTGSARSSSPRAAPTRCGAQAIERPPRAGRRRPRRCSRRTSATSARGTTSSC